MGVRVYMDHLRVAILPFVNFRQKLIRLDDFLIFSDSQISKISELSDNTRLALGRFAQGQKAFVENAYGGANNEITFVLPTKMDTTRSKLEYFLEILFFYLHKGGPAHFLLAPNVFCREDFGFFILGIFNSEDLGTLFVKKRFKFQIVDEISKFKISPHGCENVIAHNSASGYVFKDIEFPYASPVFQFLLKSLGTPDGERLARSISFYNKAMECNLKDNERFVWLSSSLESFLQIERPSNKAEAIKDKVRKIIYDKDFVVLDKSEVAENLADLIDVVYDYRSSYVHGGTRMTKHGERESKLKAKLGNVDFAIALMNIVSCLLVHTEIPDNKFEGVLNAIFYSESSLDFVMKVYGDSADTASKQLDNPENIVGLFRFLLVDLQAVSFKRKKVEKCLDNILYLFAKFARENKHAIWAEQIQQQIENVPPSDDTKFKKWNSFLAGVDSPFTPEPIYISVIIFQRLYNLLQYEYGLF